MLPIQNNLQYLNTNLYKHFFLRVPASTLRGHMYNHKIYLIQYLHTDIRYELLFLFVYVGLHNTADLG